MVRRRTAAKSRSDRRIWAIAPWQVLCHSTISVLVVYCLEASVCFANSVPELLLFFSYELFVALGIDERIRGPLSFGHISLPIRSNLRVRREKYRTAMISARATCVRNLRRSADTRIVDQLVARFTLGLPMMTTL